MTRDRWQRVKVVFHEALEHAADERAAFLDRCCANEEGVRAEVERLLAAHAEAGSFIEASPVSGLVRAAASVAAPLSGRVLGRYEVGRLIGTGGIGDVYVAHDTELGRAVALKVVTRGDRDAQLDLRREAQRASQLNHPHICTIHEVGVFDGEAYIVMEYVEGRPLHDLIAADGLPVETILRYGIQIADALAHAHGHRVLHRDLKSANVVVTTEGRAKVLDFGLARALPPELATELSRSHAALAADERLAGTLAYMAPELLRGRQADARSDIWALGVVLHEMAAGRRPFDGGTAFELSAAILNAPPAPLPARIPAALRAIIRRCLTKDPHERYGQAIEVRSALEAAQAEVVNRTSQRRLPSAMRVLQSHRAGAVVGVLAAIGVTLAFTWQWIRSSDVPVAVGSSGRPAIAVMYFDNMADAGDTAWLSKGVPNMLLTGLAQTRGLEIVSGQRLHEVARQMGHNSLEAVDGSEVADVARRAGAGAVVVGSIARVGPELRIDAQLQDLSSGRVVLAESVRGTDLFTLVDQLTSRIRDGVGFRGAANVRGVADVSSSSLEAYRLYSQGVDAKDNARWEDAQKLLDAAVAIDPAFAEAYLELTAVSGSRGRPAARREYLRKAVERADRLSERKRLVLEIRQAENDGSWAEAERALHDLIARFPDVDDAYSMGFRLYIPVIGPLQDLEKFVAIGKAGVTALPASPMTRNNYGYGLLYAGRYSEAVREFEAYARIAPREPNPFDSLGEAYLAMGLPEKAIELYSRALTIDPAYSHNGRAWSLAVLGRYDEAILDGPSIPHVKAVILSRVGRYREAAQALAAGARQAEADGNLANAGGLQLLSSLLAIERKEYARALQDIRSAERLVAQVPGENKRVHLVLADLMSGVAELKRGNIDEALSHFESQRRVYKPTVEPDKRWHHALEGEIALTRGDVQGAAAAFSTGQPLTIFLNWNSAATSVLLNLPSRDGLARVARARGDVAGAIEIYRRLLKYGPEQKSMAAFEPRYVLEIARLLAQTGQREAARQEYERFLDLWKHADADLPELAEVRRAVDFRRR